VGKGTIALVCRAARFRAGARAGLCARAAAVACAALWAAALPGILHAKEAAAMPASSPTTGSAVLVSERPFADPCVFEDGGFFHAASTGARPAMVRTRTFDPGDLEWFELELDHGAEAGKVHDVWAPRLYRHTDGSYHLYASAHYGHFQTVIAHYVPQAGEAWTAARPVTRWKLDRVLVGNIARRRHAYDGAVVRDDRGTLWLIHTAGLRREGLHPGNHILAQRMKNPGTVDSSAPPVVILGPEGLRSEDRNPGGMQLLEGAIPFRLGGRWALSYSVGDFALDNYKCALAFADELVPTSPTQYAKTKMPDPANIWGNDPPREEVKYLLQTEKPQWPNFVGAQLCGPGHASLVEIRGAPHLVFHARRMDAAGKPVGDRCLWKMPVRVNAGGDVPPGDRVAPLIRAEGAR
jgi:hypothetical protein